MRPPARPFHAAVALAGAVGIVVVGAGHAWARGGGGHSFSGGSGSHGGGGGGDGVGFLIEAIFRLLFWLVFYHPLLGIPLVIVIAIVALRILQSSPSVAFDVGGSRGSPFAPPPLPPSETPRRRLERLRDEGHDPTFSLVLFEDFLYALYARAQEARGARNLDSLAPWLSGPSRAALAAAAAGTSRVEAVVVGAMRFLSVSDLAAGRAQVRVGVEFEANYTEVGGEAGGASRSFYARERWFLVRATRAPSRTPESVRSFGCPSCGAPLDQMHGNLCGYCGKAVDTGEFDWLVERIDVVSREERGPQLTGTTEEEGTDLPTIVDPDAERRIGLLQQRDPSFTWEAFEARTRLVFQEFQAAWSDRDLPRMRPWLSDTLFETQTYWVEAYRRARLQNRLDGGRVATVQLVRVANDAHYDAVTVRIAAEGLDYTITEDGKVVGGSRGVARRFTEYWTLIRGVGVTGAAHVDKLCPSCGAELHINMAGQCEYCSSRVTSGRFDWVLSRIEQDEAYSG